MTEILLWVLAFALGDILACPIRVSLEEFVKAYTSKNWGWFESYTKEIETADQLEKLLIKLSKKRGHKRAAKQALATIQEAIKSEVIDA